jgi:general secretion pathway protein J
MASPASPRHRCRRESGLTLMEVLVTLVLISLATLLMFQTLGSYRIAKARVVAQSGTVDRKALLDAWFRESVHGLHATRRVAFKGDARAFEGLSLAPASGATGAGKPVRWSLQERARGEWRIAYAEDGQPHWDVPFADTRAASFAYLDETAKLHDAWPPRLGVQEALPAAVVLRRTAGDGTQRMPVVAAVRGARKPVDRVSELEQD